MPIELLKAWIESIVVAPIRNAGRKRGIERLLAFRYVFVLFVATATLGVLFTWPINRLNRPSIYKPSPAAFAEYEKGVNAIFANDLHEAMSAFDRAVRLDNSFVLAQVRSANVLKDLEQTAGSMGEFGTAKYKIANLRRNGKPLALDEIDSQYFSALSHTQEGNYDLAVETFSQISALTPDRFEIYLDLGLAHERNGDLEKAISSYLKATVLNPESADAFLRLGIACGKKGDFAAADAALDRAGYLYEFIVENGFEGQIEVLYQRSVLLKRQDRLREAEERASLVSHFAAVGGNSTQKVKSSFLLASILYAEGNKDSLYYENQALTLAEDFHCEELVPRGLIEIGETFRSKHKLSEAKTRFQTALAKAGSANLIYSKANALYALGQLYLQQNYPNESIPLFEEVLRIEFPDNSYSGDAPFHWRNSILNMEYQSAIRMFREKFRFARRS